MSLYLPKDKASLASAMREICAKGLEARSPLRVDWYINYWFLQGCRNFYIKSWRTGEVKHTYESSDGRLHFKYEDILEQYNRELGQWLSMDPKPRVQSKRKLELDSLRKAAMAQVILDHLTAPLDLRTLLLNAVETALMYGLVGIGAWVNRDVNLASDAMLETIPPWQILPVPARPTRPDDVRGIMRHRWVPYDELRERQGDMLKFPKADGRENADPRLGLRWLSPGERLLDNDDARDGYGGAMLPGFNDEAVMGDRPTKPEKPTDTPWVLLKEYWAFNHRNEVLRSTVLIGDYVGKDVTFLDSLVKPYMPVHLARCNHSASFYGRPYLAGQVQLTQEIELMLRNLFKNVQELDQFGMLLLPTGKGITKQDLQATGRPRVAFFEEDFTREKMQVERIQPVNTGDFPGRVAAQAIQMVDRQARNTPMHQGQMPGRLDAASGAAILLETSNVSRRPGLQSLSMALANSYKCLLSAARSLFTITDKLYLATVDDAIAGIIVDAATGEVSLDTAEIPRPHEVEVILASEEPRVLAQRKQEVLSMAANGILSPDALAWYNYKEGLGLPIDDDRSVEQRLLCMWRNIVQFGNGTEGQGVLVSPYDDHELHLKLIRRFMSRIQFSLASEKVKQLFEERLTTHEEYLGSRLPEGMPHPEELAGGVPGGPPPLPPGLPPALQQMAMKLAAKAGNQMAAGPVTPRPGIQ